MYDRIAAEYPNDPQAPKAVFAAAQVYEKGQELDKAREYYAKISEKYPDDPMAKKAQKSLNSLIDK
jgi:TolA-binding protein